MNNAQLQNFIGYQGQVTASMVVRGRKKQYSIFNSGTKNLWNLLAKAIAGYSISGEIPEYFDIVDELGNSYLRSRIPFRAKVWGEDTVEEDTENSTSVKLTVTVTKSDKRRDHLPNGSNVVLRMYNVMGNALAEITDTTDKQLLQLYNNISTGTDAIFEWVLTFSNQQKGV